MSDAQQNPVCVAAAAISRATGRMEPEPKGRERERECKGCKGTKRDRKGQRAREREREGMKAEEGDVPAHAWLLLYGGNTQTRLMHESRRTYEKGTVSRAPGAGPL